MRFYINDSMKIILQKLYFRRHWDDIRDYYHLPTKLQEGNIFSCLCLSVSPCQITSEMRVLDLQLEVQWFNTHQGVTFSYWNFLFSRNKSFDAIRKGNSLFVKATTSYAGWGSIHARWDSPHAMWYLMSHQCDWSLIDIMCWRMIMFSHACVILYMGDEDWEGSLGQRPPGQRPSQAETMDRDPLERDPPPREPHGQRPFPDRNPPPYIYRSGHYASYWNKFLLFNITSHINVRNLTIDFCEHYMICPLLPLTVHF